ncbi:dienelactone hydrolase family protein [Pedobacter sp. ISL-68]|uniref:alpha/beta hydrolase n=1 Tax=unclassified Pedobacter TaxID=2628915 RepID=UPI001BEB2A16|nr:MULTISPECIES: dienelactone hydrolase family protein [unclassified Pedobacter]MBT2564725.1 dienelactone hydrolase family protein [Pedobacter sp. ISL-64]MBT2592386.1 dienelactone hydrolase family protein [Pedobacter sp. ISL-68]
MKEIIKAGKSLDQAEKVLIMIHGRGGTAQDILSMAEYLEVSKFALIAPQAENNTWYPQSFLAPRAANEPSLSNALKTINDIVIDLGKEGFTKEQIYFLGFSQGACLTLDFVASNAARYGGVVAFTGGLIGEEVDHRNYHGDFDGTPVFIGSSDPDMHVPVSRVKESTVLLEGMGAKVTEIIYQNMGHTISHSEITQVNKLIFNG